MIGDPAGNNYLQPTSVVGEDWGSHKMGVPPDLMETADTTLLCIKMWNPGLEGN